MSEDSRRFAGQAWCREANTPNQSADPHVSVTNQSRAGRGAGEDCGEHAANKAPQGRHTVYHFAVETSKSPRDLGSLAQRLAHTVDDVQTCVLLRLHARGRPDMRLLNRGLIECCGELRCTWSSTAAVGLDSNLPNKSIFEAFQTMDIPDLGLRVPVAVICDLAGVSQSKHTKWALQGVVRTPASSDCSVMDALELALAQDLVPHLKRLGILRIAMKQLVSALPDLPESGMLDVVHESKFGTAQWTRSPDELAAFGRRYHRILVVDMRARVDDVRRGFVRRAEDRASQRLRVVQGKLA